MKTNLLFKTLFLGSALACSAFPALAIDVQSEPDLFIIDEGNRSFAPCTVLDRNRSLLGTIDDRFGSDIYWAAFTNPEGTQYISNRNMLTDINLDNMGQLTSVGVGQTKGVGAFYNPFISDFRTLTIYEANENRVGTIIYQEDVPQSVFDEMPDSCRPSNVPPVSNAGETIRYAIPNKRVYLDGTQSMDEDGDDLTYMWTQISGPAVELINGDTATPSFYYPSGRADQVIQFELVVNDGTVDSEPSTVTIIHNGRSNGKPKGRK